MSWEDQSQAGRSGNKEVAEAGAFLAAHDPAQGTVEKALSDVVALLARGSAEFSFACEGLSKAGRLSPMVHGLLTSIKTMSQAIDLQAENAISLADVAVPQVNPVQQLDGQRGDGERGRSRRPKNRAFDFLLLEALHVRTRLTVPVGLDDMKRIAAAFDPSVKPTSLVAKLNRWKNVAKFLTWTSHENMSLTPAGITKRNELLDLARKTGRLKDVNDAIFGVLGVRSNY